MPAGQWNYADIWEDITARFPTEPALFHGPLERSWAEFDARAESLGATLVAAGLDRQDKVAQYCRNRPEYLETMYACFKAALVPVNTNFRYGDEELVYLWEDSDTAAVVFDEEFTDTCDRLRSTLPRVRAWIRVGDATTCPDWALDYGTVAEAGDRVETTWTRSGDDLILLYTGGTTGMPKGVMWPQHDFFQMIERQYGRMPPEEADLEGYLGRLNKAGPRVLPGPPLMHGTASWFSIAALSNAGSVVTLTERSFDAVELLDTVVDRAVKGVCIVGDPFARPIIRQLETHPGRWDLSGVRLLMSSGAMLSRESKEKLIAYAPGARVVDGLGSSESGSLGTAVTEKTGDGETARFRLGSNVRVVDDGGADVEPGSGVAGRLAVGGFLPLGYYGDPEKTASTFVTLDGKRYVIAGDWALVEADGSITLLGRGSNCINTAGEKVFPEEVEEVMKRAAGVHDASVVGVPDDRFGQAVVALVELEPGADIDETALIAHAKSHLAGYKAPKTVIVVDRIARHANGKMNYSAMNEVALATMGRA